MTKSSKTTRIHKQQIIANRSQINTLLSGAESIKRLNNLNWLRHEISYSEPIKLKSEQFTELDFTCTKNLGDAYDYILNNQKELIDAYSICKIHAMLCNGTYLNPVAGQYRESSKMLEIIVNGERYYAPEAYEVPSKMNKIVFDLHNSKNSVLTKAFNIHYELIALQPFEDFNKRTARLIMNWFLIQNGFRPIIFNEKSDKQNYKKAITACLNGDKKSYVAYMTECMVRTQNQIINLLKKSKTM